MGRAKAVLRPPNVSRYPLADICFNISYEGFVTDLPDVLRRARDANVRQLVCVGSTLENSKETLQLIQQHTIHGISLVATAGAHPLYLTQPPNPKLLNELRQLVQDPIVCAIGETGLDYCAKFDPKTDLQKAWFREHVAMAAEMKKPLFLHEREAVSDFLHILDLFGQDLPPVCVHCFSGTREELQEYLQRGFYIGVTGYFLQKRGQHCMDLLQHIPLSRIMIESDAPYLTPDGSAFKRFKRRNEPCCVPALLPAFAPVMGISEEALATAVRDNANVFFGLSENTG